jgi:hypothetical protein
MTEITWACHVCGRKRPDSLISVCKKDLSANYGLPANTITNNVRFCNDNPDCIEKAKTVCFVPK